MEKGLSCEQGTYFSVVEILHKGLRRSVKPQTYKKLNLIRYLKQKKPNEHEEELQQFVSPVNLEQENTTLKMEIYHLKQQNSKLKFQITQENRIQAFFKKKFQSKNVEQFDTRKLRQLFLSYKLYTLDSKMKERQYQINYLSNKKNAHEITNIYENVLDANQAKIGEILFQNDEILTILSKKQTQEQQLSHKIQHNNTLIRMYQKKKQKLKQKIESISSEINQKNRQLNEKNKSRKMGANISVELFDTTNGRVKNDEEIQEEIEAVIQQQKKMNESIQNLMEDKIRNKLTLYHHIDILRQRIKKLNTA